MSARALVIVGVILELIVFVLYGIFVRFDELARMDDSHEFSQESFNSFTLRYPILQDVHVMMFIGFGFLMTFLKHHSWSGVSINFIAAAVAIQFYILFHGFWNAVAHNDWTTNINISTDMFIRADYCAAAILISFGAVIGKINVAQMLVMVFIESFVYSLQEMLVYEKIKTIDAGGSIVIHTFGAYYGLMFSLIFSPKTVIGNPYNDSCYNSNLFSMIGTIFLWMHWPSFNAGIVENTAAMHRAVANTILSLTGSCVSTFMVSALFNEGKFHMEDILNATLAGGVIIGSSCDIITYPFISLLLGFFAGVLSTVGFKRITRFLEHHIGLFDTAGINNLHGMPGFLGGIFSAIIIAGYSANVWSNAPPEYTFTDYFSQGGLQIAGTFTSAGFGLVSGAISAFIVKYLPLNQTQSLFEDKPYWIKCVPDPYENLTVANPVFTNKDNFSESPTKLVKKESQTLQDKYNMDKKDKTKGKKQVSSDSDY